MVWCARLSSGVMVWCARLSSGVMVWCARLSSGVMVLVCSSLKWCNGFGVVILSADLIVSHSNQRLYNSDVCCFSAKYIVYRSKSKDCLRIRIMCLSGVTCLHVDSCIC